MTLSLKKSLIVDLIFCLVAKKILSIASIFIQNPYVYLLDEPLANLDFFTRK